MDADLRTSLIFFCTNHFARSHKTYSIILQGAVVYHENYYVGFINLQFIIITGLSICLSGWQKMNHNYTIMQYIQKSIFYN